MSRFALYITWPFQVILSFPKMLKGIALGDSFYAKSLGFFYLRQIKLIKNKQMYINEVKGLNIASFVYQSFSSVYLCYSFLGRRLSVLISIVIIMTGYAIFVKNEVLFILLVSASSAVSYYFIAERGNYQFIPLAISIFSLMLLFDHGFTWNVLLLVMLSSFLSISMAIILAIFFISTLIFTNDSSYMYGFLAICFGACINIIVNFYFLKLHKKGLISIFQSITKVFRFINGDGKENNQNKSLKEVSFIRPIIIKNGVISVLPLFLIINLYGEMNQLFIIYTFIAIIFINQSRILRIFDFHLIYGFVFFYSVFLLGMSQINIINIIAIFLLGTNPILIYALDRNRSFSRGFRCSLVSMVTTHQSGLILQNLHLLFNSDTDTVLIKPIKEVYEYNDLWSVESLFLEWLWTALENKDIPYFPDWYSVMYSENGKSLLSCLMFNPESLSKKNRLTVSFKDTQLEECNKKDVMIKSIMPKRVMSLELACLDCYCIVIEKDVQV